MVNSTPILSIIIPTKNRSEYAMSAIKSILNMSSDLFELVVQDNSDNNKLEDHLNKIYLDSRLSYSHTREHLDVIANFNKALSLAKGEYITFIGDDDGVNPEIIEAAMWAKSNDIDALTPYLVADYLWPDLRQKYYGAKFSGGLKIKDFSGLISFPDVENGMIDCAQRGAQNLVNFVGLPKLYYGIVKKDCLEKVRKKTGTYFPGVSPDMSGAMAVASFVRRMCAIDYPLFVPGSSSKSTAGISAEKKHFGRLQDQLHLPHGCWDNWPAIVPAFYAVQTVWAQSAVRALEATGREDILAKFNIPLLHAMCAVFNPYFMAFTIRSYLNSLRKSKKNLLIGILLFSFSYIHVWGWRVESLLSRMFSRFRPSNVIIISNINDINEAVIALSRHLEKTGKSLGEILHDN